MADLFDGLFGDDSGSVDFFEMILALENSSEETQEFPPEFADEFEDYGF